MKVRGRGHRNGLKSVARNVGYTVGQARPTAGGWPQRDTVGRVSLTDWADESRFTPNQAPESLDYILDTTYVSC